MKTVSVSTASISNALRLTVAQAQQQLQDAQKEATTGVYADVGASLGADMTRNLDLTRDVMRIQSTIDTNSVATQRLSASQAALEQISEAGKDLLNALLPLANNVDASSLSTLKTSANTALTVFTSMVNTSFNGEYIFAGTNTDVKPLTDYTAPGNPAKAAHDAALTTFMAAQAPPVSSPSQFTPAQMNDFIDNTLTPMFTGAGWDTNWSDASNQNMMSRIGTNETLETSTNANSSGMRNFALASVIATELLSKDLSTETRKAVASKAINLVSKATSEIDSQRTTLGLSESRVTQANEILRSQKTIIETHLSDLNGVDGYEAASRMSNLTALVEASMTLTSRIQKLSLVNFL